MHICIIPEYKSINTIPDRRLILPNPLLTPGPHLIAVDVVEPAVLVSYQTSLCISLVLSVGLVLRGCYYDLQRLF